ncbi:MAG: hypothetical protein WB626_02540 [Bacteroidota bacterium]
MKVFFTLLGIALLAALFWVAFALWSGIYSVYSYPPGREAAYPDGATLLVERDTREPMFNSPNAKPLPPPQQSGKGRITFGPVPKPMRPVARRIVVRFPFIRWAYEKSLEPVPAP